MYFNIISLLGAMIGGTFEGVACRTVAELAKNKFELKSQDSGNNGNVDKIKSANIW